MKYSSSLLCLCIFLSLHADNDNLPLMGKTYLAPRSTSTNAALEMVGWQRYINQPYKEWYGSLTITPFYAHSFRPRRLAEYFFGTDTLIITGSEVSTRSSTNQILADYFGLPTEYQSTVVIRPEIRTFLVDFDWYLGYENYYLRIHAPYGWTRWDFGLTETPAAQSGTNPFPALYMAAASIPAGAQSFTQALQGGITYGQVTEGLNYGLVNGPQSTHALSEVQIAFGYNFANSYRGHAGFNLRGSIPTGTRPNGTYLFEPTIGNGHHGELGVGFTGHALLWERAGEDKINFYADVNITHLFATRQRRSFDLKPVTYVGSDIENFQGFASRYMLMKEFGISGNYTGNTIPVINRTTLECDVSMDVEFDIVLMADYINSYVTVDFGYNGWLRTREKISNVEPLPANTYALKGIQNVAINNVTNSNITQSDATIYGDLYTNQAADADNPSPVFILSNALDLNSAANPFAFTHKFFGHISYNWPSNCFIEPFLGIGGQVEFQGLHPSDVEPNKLTIQQWGIWLKGGIGF